MKCFSFKELKFKYGIFDESVDCTYIIHLEKNTQRLKNIKIQLHKYAPSKKIYIYNNKGFKKCKKNLYKQKSNYDIIHSYLEIFKHAHSKKYNNILVLEDDFILDRIILHEDINNINKFCLKNKQEYFNLSMGTVPLLFYPINKHFNKPIINFGVHNTIYSKKMRINLLNNEKYIYKVGDWDVYNNLIKNRYFYYKPLIYQRFEETENQKNWPLFICFKYICLKYIKYMNFKNNPKKAFELHYKISFGISLLLFLFIIFIIYKLFFYLSCK